MTIYRHSVRRISKDHLCLFILHQCGNYSWIQCITAYEAMFAQLPNIAKRTAWQTVVKIITTGFVLALVAGAIIKLKVFGGGN